MDFPLKNWRMNIHSYQRWEALALWWRNLPPCRVPWAFFFGESDWWRGSFRQLYCGWLVVWNMNFIFPHIGTHNSNWLILFRGVETTNQILWGYDYWILWDMTYSQFCRFFWPLGSASEFFHPFLGSSGDTDPSGLPSYVYNGFGLLESRKSNAIKLLGDGLGQQRRISVDDVSYLSCSVIFNMGMDQYL